MSEEKKMILNMLKEGKISEDEALKLLEAIKDSDEPKGEKRFDEESFERKMEGFANKFTSGVESIVKKTGQALSNIRLGYDFDVDFGNGKSYNLSKLKSETTRDFDHKIDSNSYSFNIINRNGDTVLRTNHEDKIHVHVDIRYDDKYIDDDFTFVDFRVDDHEIVLETVKNKYKKQPYNANLTISIPQDMNLSELTIQNVNGDSSIIGIQSDRLIVEDVNGDVGIKYIKADLIDLSNVNGDIKIEDSSSSTSKLNTVNGDIDLLSNNEKINLVEADTVNGSIKVRLPEKKAIQLNCSSLIDNFKSTKLPDNFTVVKRKTRSLKATTHDYRIDSDDRMDLELSTVNGKISFKF